MQVNASKLAMHIIFLEIGGNQGDRMKNILLARNMISDRVGTIVNFSSVYQTPPWGFESDLAFYNQALKIETRLSVGELLKVNLQIEKELGRVRSKDKYSSRTMDVDILFYNNQCINQKELIVPHPRLHLRKFVLVPLNEIAPDFIHPVLNKSISELLNLCDDKSNLLLVKNEK